MPFLLSSCCWSLVALADIFLFIAIALYRKDRHSVLYTAFTERGFHGDWSTKMRDDKVTLDECVRAECISPKTGVVVITIRLFSLSLSAITFLTGLYCRHSVTFVCVFFIEGFGKLSLPERFSLDEKKQTRITNWGYRGRRRFCRYPERKRPPLLRKRFSFGK